MKRSTFPFLCSLTVRSPCLHRAFIVRSSCVFRSFTVRSSFTVLRSPLSVRSSSPFTKRSSFTHCAFSYRSQNVHHSLIVLKAFKHFHSELQRERIVLKGRGPGINSSQSKNVGKIQLSMQLSHLTIIFENIWF